MKQYKYYLFDFDGTLLDTFDANLIIFKNAYKAINIDITEEEALLFTRIPLPKGFEMKGGKEEDKDTFVKSIRAGIDSPMSIEMSKLFFDTNEVINALKEKGAVLAIVTSNSATHVRDVLTKKNIDQDIFEIIVGHKEAPIPKPSPSPILKTLDLLEVTDKSGVIYIGDAINDCIAAREAGVDFLLLDRNHEYQDSEFPRIFSLKELLN